MKITIEFPHGYLEQVATLHEAETKIKESRISDEGEMRVTRDGMTIKYEEYRCTGPDGSGYYFAGKITVNLH